MEIDAAAREIDGQILIRIEADPKNGTSVFNFDLGASLHTWPWEDEKTEDQWLLYKRGGDAFIYRGDGCYSFGPADQEEDQAVWLPLPSFSPRS